MKITNSKALFKKAKKLIPGQSQTFSKSWTQYPFGCSPIFRKSNGGYLWDVDGNKFIDWPMALGPIVLGHNNKSVIMLYKRLKKGIAFSLPNKLKSNYLKI